MAGICGGGQLLNVLSGGAMYQDVDGHTTNHSIMDIVSKATVMATSTHHQMMKPSDGAMLLATARQTTQQEWYPRNMKKPMITHNKLLADVEVCYYMKSNSLCFQPHPEYGSKELKDWYFKYIDTYLFIPTVGKVTNV